MYWCRRVVERKIDRFVEGTKGMDFFQTDCVSLSDGRFKNGVMSYVNKTNKVKL